MHWASSLSGQGLVIRGQQLAASTCCYVIIVKAFLRKAKGMESIDTKVLVVELKQFIDIYSRKGVDWTQLGHLV